MQKTIASALGFTIYTTGCILTCVKGDKKDFEQFVGDVSDSMGKSCYLVSPFIVPMYGYHVMGKCVGKCFVPNQNKHNHDKHKQREQDQTEGD